MENQEHRTFLSKGTITDKTDPRIEFRGRLDSLVASVVELQILGQREKADSLAGELEEVRAKIYEIFSCEVTGKKCKKLSLWGLSSDEIRERSHHPEHYFGIGHIRPHHTMGVLASALNALRTQVREAELSACRAFNAYEPENTERADVVEVLNRLSSAIYILIYKYLPEGYDKTVKW